MISATLLAVVMLGCQPPDDGIKGADTSASSSDTDVALGADDTDTAGPVDIRDAEFTERSGACSDYVGEYTAAATDQQSGVRYTASVSITAVAGGCMLVSNGIPNHDFNLGGRFAPPVAEVTESFTLAADPSATEGGNALK